MFIGLFVNLLELIYDGEGKTTVKQYCGWFQQRNTRNELPKNHFQYQIT